jgi:hypothetical protein
MEQNNSNDIGFIGKHRLFLSAVVMFITFKIVVEIMASYANRNMGFEIAFLAIPVSLIVAGILYTITFKLLTFQGVSKEPTIEERKDWLLILLIPLLIVLMFPAILPLL